MLNSAQQHSAALSSSKEYSAVLSNTQQHTAAHSSAHQLSAALSRAQQGSFVPSDAQLCKKVISSTLCAQQLSAALKNTKEYQKIGTIRIENKLELLTNLNNPELVYGSLNG